MSKNCLDCDENIEVPLTASTIEVASPDNSIQVVPQVTPAGKKIFNLVVEKLFDLLTKPNKTIVLTGKGITGNELRAEVVKSPDTGNIIELRNNGVYVSGTGGDMPPIDGGDNIDYNPTTGAIDWNGFLVQQDGNPIATRKKVNFASGDNTSVSVIDNGSSADSVTVKVEATGGGTGDITDGANVGTGVELFKAKSGSNLQFRTISEGDNINIDDSDPNNIIISAASSGGGGSAGFLTGNLG